MEREMLEIRIDHVLAQPPQVAVPVDFAARVAAKAAALPPRKAANEARYGRMVALAAAALLVAALFVLAPFADPTRNSFGFCTEMLVLLQLCVLAWWFSHARREVF